MEAGVGFEPTKTRVKVLRHNQLGEPAKWNRDRSSTCIFPLAGNVLIRRPIQIDGRSRRSRTPRYMVPNHVLYPMSYTPTWYSLLDSNQHYALIWCLGHIKPLSCRWKKGVKTVEGLTQSSRPRTVSIFLHCFPTNVMH